ncbi:hypothetical protein [Fimbriiglobus ruber]|uniref:PepSY domain-containing protein n=1 Tax=Fimbriiglobus ruber TaxID=1908690 RepID=A0A225DUB8_9BACT|nr:hypothetical protein [Fimbriiglobus ruber]OWK43244.1 hypothetical protein FRUB_02843 [Fimbriiglobus ruber]
MRAIVAALALAVAVGCGGEKGGKESVPLEQVPANVMTVAKEKLPGVTFDRAWRKKNGEFEVSGKDKKGKIREIDITPDGTVTEIE